MRLLNFVGNLVENFVEKASNFWIAKGPDRVCDNDSDKDSGLGLWDTPLPCDLIYRKKTLTG